MAIKVTVRTDVTVILRSRCIAYNGLDHHGSVSTAINKYGSQHQVNSSRRPRDSPEDTTSKSIRELTDNATVIEG
jgi:hypothetical protein